MQHAFNGRPVVLSVPHVAQQGRVGVVFPSSSSKILRFLMAGSCSSSAALSHHFRAMALD